MGGDASVLPARAPGPSRGTKVGVVVGLLACGVLTLVQTGEDHVGALTVVLAVSAIAAGAFIVESSGRVALTPVFVVVTLAAGLLGPVSAVLINVPVELIALWRVKITGWLTASNLLAAALPVLVAADIIRAVAPTDRRLVTFYLVLAAAGFVMLSLNFALVALFSRLFRGPSVIRVSVFWDYFPTQALNIGIAVAGAAIYVRVGLLGIVFALLALISFAYMAQLLERSRERAEQYVALSLGVLSGLVKAVDKRDGRAGRHAAAVARFARDIAAEAGLSEADQELAHTAGLLHDIGHFALYDRVYEPGRPLTDDDWIRINDHPVIGAELVHDLGGYGPVAEIVRAHHERIDGLGYPDGLAGDEIPIIARVVAVAEVYDTLTATDTYRPQMHSIEALAELRRVAGTQLDPVLVEALARALAREGHDYRVAETADFDAELDLERRIKEARAG